MNVEINLTETDLRALVLDHIQSKLGDIKLEPSDVKIEVKSKQNYKAEWEPAHYRARVSVAS